MATTTAQTDFAKLDLPGHVRHFELEGYTIFPGILRPEYVDRIQGELADLPMRPSFYSPDPCFGAKPPQWHSPAVGELIGYEPMIAFLKTLLGEDIVYMHGHFIRSQPGQPLLELHADWQPYGSQRVGWQESVPVRVRVLYYLDDTAMDCGALRIVPRSHISFHADALPYRRYLSHPDEQLVTFHAGDALAFGVRMFHGTGANTSDHSRGMLEMDYRPLWSRPVEPMDEWAAEDVAKAPAVAKPFLKGQNAFDEAWEKEGLAEPLPAGGTGLDPGRWG